MSPEPPTHPEEIVIRSSTGLMDHSAGDSPVGTVPERRAGEEQEFEIAPGIKIVMCWIPPGDFLMGSPEDEAGHTHNETQHRVTITQGFWLAKTLTTQAQWKAVMLSKPSHFKWADLPVESVSWNDISEPGGFMERVNRVTVAGGIFSLPTEAQWEYACRAGTTTAFNNSKNLPFASTGICPDVDEVAWHIENSAGKTHPGGRKKANAWGLHDMHGNVWEWCVDLHEDYTTEVQVDPRGPVSGSSRVFRGGSWNNYASNCRAANRGKCEPSARRFVIGFRVARSSDPLCVQKYDDVEACVGDDEKSDPPTPTESGLIIQSSTGLVSLPEGCSPALSQIISQTPAHSQTRNALAVPEPHPGEEQEFEIAPGVKVMMRWIPPGEFLMGSPEGEYIPFDWDPEYPYEHETSHESETPHHVTITQGFWLGKYQVTQAQWEAVMGSNPSKFKGSNLPVETVSWEDISNPGGFIEKANCFAAAEEIFALPTEAQWEYACRAGTWTSLNNGKNLSRTVPPVCPNLDEVAWCPGNSCKKPHPVGQKKPNAWGLHDMHGNVWEWCMDIYERYPTGPLVDPRVGYSSDSFWFYRVLRGGSWSGMWPSYMADCRSANRCLNDQNKSNSDMGFRIARISRPPCVQKSDDVEVCVVEDAEPQPLTFTENSHVITPLTALESLPKAVSPDFTRLSLNHIQTSHAPPVSERLAGEEQEFEISPGVKIVMCWIPPGVFLMGSPENAVGRAKSETQHRVTITEGFWLGKYQVTQAQWQTVMGSQPSRFKGADLPVEQVSWNDISEPGGFIEKLNGISTAGWNFYLPTEAQWEYACRPARGSGPHPGLDEVAWYSKNSSGRTQPVGQKQANDWGIHDMKGNVAEWCMDWHDDYTDALQVDPQGPNSGSERVFRGGFWCARPEHCMRRAIRYKGDPATTCEWLGFRVARSSSPIPDSNLFATSSVDSVTQPLKLNVVKQFDEVATNDDQSLAPPPSSDPCPVTTPSATLEIGKDDLEVETGSTATELYSETPSSSTQSNNDRTIVRNHLGKVERGEPPVNKNNAWHYRKDADGGIYVSTGRRAQSYVTDQAIDDELAKNEGKRSKAVAAIKKRLAALGWRPND